MQNLQKHISNGITFNEPQFWFIKILNLKSHSRTLCLENDMTVVNNTFQVTHMWKSKRGLKTFLNMFPFQKSIQLLTWLIHRKMAGYISVKANQQINQKLSTKCLKLWIIDWNGFRLDIFQSGTKTFEFCFLIRLDVNKTCVNLTKYFHSC